MEVKKITEGMTAPQVAQVIDDNFKAQNKILEDDIKKQNNAIGVSEYQAFSEAESVAVGAVRLYNGVLYECVEATTGAFDASKWKKSSFKDETEKKLSELASEVDNKIGDTTPIVLTSKDLIGATWNGTSIVASTTFNMWVVPLYVGRRYSIERVNVSTQSVRTCSEYPSIGKTIEMNSVTQSTFTAKEGEKYLVITVAMSSYENGEIHITKNEVGLSKRIADLQIDIQDLDTSISQTSTSLEKAKKSITSNIESITKINNNIGSLGGIITLKESDLIGATWNGTSIVASTTFNMWVVPLKEGSVVKTTSTSYIQSVRTCSVYPSLGLELSMEGIPNNSFTVSSSMRYLVITVTMSSYNGESVDIEFSESGMQQALQEVKLKSEKNENEIIELNKTIGNSEVTREYTSSDFYGAIWNGSQIVKSNDTYNSLLIPISIGQSVKIEGFAAHSTSWGFKDKPVIGTTETPTRIYLGSHTEGTEDIQFILVGLKVSEFISTTATFSAQGLIKEIETLKEGGNLKKLLEGKTIVCFGDSLTEFNGTDGKGYGEHLEALSGAKVVRGGIGGTQLATRATPVLNPTDYKPAYGAVDISNLAKSWANNDWEIVDNAITWLAENRDDDNSAVVERLKNCPIETTDIVIVFGGSNDLNNSTYGKPTDTNPIGNTCGGINQIIDSILSVKPNMVIYFFTPIPRMATSEVWSDDYRVGQTDSNGDDLSFRGMVKRIKECSEYNHIPCCDMYNEIGITRHNIYTYASDGVHPNYGYSLLANRMFGFISANRNWKI